MIQARLLLANQSEFALSGTHLEVVCLCTEGHSVSLLRADHMPDEPDSSHLAHIFGPSLLERINQRMSVDERGSEPIAHIELGTMRPGQVARAEEDLAILPSAPGHYVLQVRVFANEIPTPLLIEHPFEATGPVIEASESDLDALMFTSVGEDERDQD